MKIFAVFLVIYSVLMHCKLDASNSLSNDSSLITIGPPIKQEVQQQNEDLQLTIVDKVIPTIQPYSNLHQPINGTNNYEDSAEDNPITAGIYFRISQKGVEYITNLAAEALPQLLADTIMPPVEQTQVKISELKIEEFEKPSIKSWFIAGKGIGANISLPIVRISAMYDASTFFTTYTGKFKAELKNLSVFMEVYISRNESTKTNIIETSKCNVAVGQVLVVFIGDMSTYLNLLRSVIEQTVTDVLGNELCTIPQTITYFFEQQKRQILNTTPLPPLSTPTPTYSLAYNQRWNTVTEKIIAENIEKPTAGDDSDSYETSSEEVEEDSADSFAASLCANDRIDMGNEYSPLGERIRLERDTEKKPGRLNPLLTEGLWAPDLTLIHPLHFTNDSVIFGLDGGMTFYGERAKNIFRPKFLNVSALGNQMFGLLISEYVPNSFFSHVYRNQLGIIQEIIKTDNMPKYAKAIAEILCSSCKLQLTANLTEEPEMRIGQNGVKLIISGELLITFIGKNKERNLMNANTMLDITVRPYLKHSRIYGEVMLTGIDIKMQKMGIAGVFADSVRKALNTIIPKRLWPKIKKRMRFALSQRGIKLPILCGVELERPSLTYIEHAIVVDTDFSYDLPRFVRKFKAFINAERLRMEKKERFHDD